MRLLIEELACLGEVGLQLFDSQAKSGIKGWAGFGCFYGLCGVVEFNGSAFQAGGTAATDFLEKLGDGIGFFGAEVGDEL